MNATENFDDEAIAGGLSSAEIQAVARRQLVASIAVAVVIALGVGLAALMPASHASNDAEAAPHRLALVQQPTFATPLSARLASAKQREIELP
jgi:hypothetical protein